MPGVPDAQRDRALRRFPLRRLRLPMGDGQLSVVIPDERAWVREGSWAPGVVRGKEPPYWIRIWPAALAAARALHRVEGLAGLRVLDLGCGLGIPGVQAAQGGGVVTFADLEHDAIAFARWNAKHQLGCSTAPAGVSLDWSRERVDGLFDLLLLSDVSYHEKHHAPLLRHLEQCLAEGGVALHTDPHREVASAFLAKLDGDYVRMSWTRPTVVQDRRANVRVAIIARSPEVLEAWRTRFGALGYEGHL